MSKQPRCPECDAAVHEDDIRCPRCKASLDVDEALADAPRDRPRRRTREDDEDDDDIPRARRLRRRQPETEATDLLVPTNVSAWAIVGCYAGLIGLVIPLFGLPFAVAGLVCSIIALRKPSRGTSYGAVTSNIRAIIGLICGGLGTLIYGAVAIFLLLDMRNW